MELVDVAAAVLIRENGDFLLAQRPPHTVYAGYWEFPGGKVEPGESHAEALVRELQEELGVEVRQVEPWLTRTFSYPHATVRLRFFRVRDWRGIPHGREKQALAWQPPGANLVGPMLPANAPVLRALTLPEEYAVSNAAQVGPEVFLQALEQRLQDGLRLVQLREPTLDAWQCEVLARRALELTRRFGARLLINGRPELARSVGADGVHLSARQLLQLENRPDFELVGASVHDQEELRQAERLELDFAVLGSVHATPSHPGGTVLGWDGFRRIAADASLPIYAIGGLQIDELPEARRHGAHGIVMIRGSWTPAT